MGIFKMLKIEIYNWFSKTKAKLRREKISFLEKKLKYLEQNSIMKKQNYNIILLKKN